MSSQGGQRVVVAALSINVAIAIFKFIAAFFSRSSAMLAEACHSLADTINQVFLLIGARKSARPPTPEHPFGFGPEIYFWAFMVAISIFALGAGFSIHEGVEKIWHRHEPGEALGDARWAYAVLGVSILLESYSLQTAMKEFRHIRQGRSISRTLKEARDPTVLTVLFEDIAALFGLCKALIAADDKAKEQRRPAVLDNVFINQHTHGFGEFATAVRGYEWPELEKRSGLTRIALEAAATVYARADKVIGIYGMGLTQHRLGVETVQLLMNFLLLRGNIGKPGAGICPVRGHSNVQGQRTVGITEKPELVPLDKLAKQFGFKPPRDKGLNTVEACEGILKGEVRGFIGLGGNFVRAIPERALMEPAWRKLRLTVQIATKLNRSHLIHGEVTYLLPCLGRIEADQQATGPQSVTVEDSTSCIHGSLGMQPPASVHLLSEPAIVAGLAKATLPPNPKLDWDAWVGDYALVRDAIAETYPENFHDFNERMWQPGGFHRHLPARHREWKTKTGKANFIVPKGLETDPDAVPESRDVLRLITLRSNDQFNTTIYGYRDRFRGIEGTRMVVLMNRNDIARLELHEGQRVVLVTAADDGVDRRLAGLTIVAYDIPEGCCGGYYPECNVLVPLWHHAERAKVPAAKSVPVRIVADDAAADEPAAPSDMISGSPVSDAGRDVATAAGAAGRAAMRNPVQTALLTVAAGLAIGAAVKAGRGRSRR